MYTLSQKKKKKSFQTLKQQRNRSSPPRPNHSIYINKMFNKLSRELSWLNYLSFVLVYITGQTGQNVKKLNMEDS